MITAYASWAIGSGSQVAKRFRFKSTRATPTCRHDSWTRIHSPGRLVPSRCRGKASHFLKLTRSVQALHRVISSSCIGSPSLDKRLQLLKLILRRWPNRPIVHSSLMSSSRSLDGCDMLTVGLDNMFSSPRSTNDKTAIVWLNKDIRLPDLLDIVDHLVNRASLSRSQTGMFASGYARLALISGIFRRRVS